MSRGQRSTVAKLTTIVVALALFGTACAVQPETRDITLNTNAVQAREQRLDNIANAPDPTQANELETNEAGEQLLQRFLTGEFFQDLSHGVTGDPCGTQIALAFLNDPSTEPDMTCALPENRTFSFDE